MAGGELEDRPDHGQLSPDCRTSQTLGLLLHVGREVARVDGDATAAEVWKALHPSTAQFGDGARVIVSSTPFGDAGFFAETFEQARSGALVGAVAARHSTAEVNPTIPAAMLEAERARDPESFAEEFEAAFLGSGAAFFDFDRFSTVARDPAEPEEGTAWVAGLDPAFSRDPFGLALLGRDAVAPGRLIMGPVLGLLPGRPEPSGAERAAITERLLGQVKEECCRYRAQAFTDQHENIAVVERLTRAAVPVHVLAMTQGSKTEIYSALRAVLYDGTLELRTDDRLLSELRRVRTRTTGAARAVVTPRVAGSHGDRAQALALAVWGLTKYGGGVEHGVRSGAHGRLLGNTLGMEL